MMAIAGLVFVTFLSLPSVLRPSRADQIKESAPLPSPGGGSSPLLRWARYGQDLPKTPPIPDRLGREERSPMSSGRVHPSDFTATCVIDLHALAGQ